MIAIEIKAGQIRELIKATEAAKKSFAKELAGAINAVAKKTKLQIGRDVRKTINMKKAESEKTIKMSSKATADNLSVTVSLKATRKPMRPGLQHFGARQDKKGVSYRISKTGGRKRVVGAFMGPSPGTLAPKLYGGVFKRVGKERLPIVRLQGISAYAAYAKNDLDEPQILAINEELTKQMERRIKLNVLRANGLVSK